MGVLNVTPDSFSDGGRWFDVDDAVAHGRRMLDEGADVIDVGGESTRPGAAPVSEAEEIARIVPVVESLRADVIDAGARLSVDTRHADVARAACAAGATIVNDVSSALAHVAAESGAGWVAMHMAGEPGTMQDDPHYDDVVSEVLGHLVARADAAHDLGIEELWIDPGIGFGKTFDHNWTLLAALDRFTATGLPVAVGTSRKGFLGAVLSAADGLEQPVGPDDRLAGSVTTAVWAATMGVSMIRVHDVADTVAALCAARLHAPGLFAGAGA